MSYARLSLSLNQMAITATCATTVGIRHGNAIKQDSARAENSEEEKRRRNVHSEAHEREYDQAC